MKYFTPHGGFTWSASEGSPVDEDGYYDTDKEKVNFVFFGLVDNQMKFDGLDSGIRMVGY